MRFGKKGNQKPVIYDWYDCTMEQPKKENKGPIPKVKTTKDNQQEKRPNEKGRLTKKQVEGKPHL